MGGQIGSWFLLISWVSIQCAIASPELLQNADFESTNYNGNWGCQGGCHLSSSANKYHGSHSVHVTNRHANWNGLSQNVNVVAGQHYNITAYVQLLSTVNNTASQTAQIMMACVNQKGHNIYFNFGANAHVTPGNWFQIGGIKQIPTGSHNCHMYVQTAAPTEYLVDSASARLVPVNNDWKTKANARIEQLRKANVSISFAGSNIGGASFDIELVQTGQEFILGSVVDAHKIIDSSHQAYQQVYYDNFEWGVLGNALKWLQMERHQGQIDYNTPMNAINALRSHGKKVRGHCMFWSSEKRVQDWVKALDSSSLMSAIHTRIQGVMGHTRGKLEHWDVNNEDIHNNFYERHTGHADITMRMFRQAHAVDSHPKLFLNEYNVLDNHGQIAMALKDKAARYVKAGVPIGGIGIQGHLHSFDLTEIQANLDLVAEAGLPLLITEFAINDPHEHTKASKLSDLMTLFFAHPAVEGVVFWGYWDGDIWEPNAALFTGSGVTPNAAGRALIDLLKNQWRSHSTFTLHGHQVKQQRLFKGTYRLTVKSNGHVVKTEDFTLTDAGNDIQIHLGHTGGSPSVSHIVVG